MLLEMMAQHLMLGFVEFVESVYARKGTGTRDTIIDRAEVD